MEFAVGLLVCLGVWLFLSVANLILVSIIEKSGDL